MMKHFQCNCFWCNKGYSVRVDTYKRQMDKYGHVCCQQCFGKEPTFKAARSKGMLANNPFKGKRHTSETKIKLSKSKMGKPGWNKGLTKENNESVRKYAAKVSASKKGKQSGANNPNWKGGISGVKQPIKPELKAWLKFRHNRIKEDCYKCAKCNNKFLIHELEVHHIAPRREHKELEFDELNSITLCKPCHKSFHKKYGRKNVAPGSTYKWLNEDRKPEDYFTPC